MEFPKRRQEPIIPLIMPIYGNQQQMITTRPRFGAVQADRPYYQPTAHFALGSFVVPNSITRPLVSIMLPYKSHPNWINIAQQGTYFGCNCQRCSYYARYLCPRINSGTAIKNFTQYHPLRLVDSQLVPGLFPNLSQTSMGDQYGIKSLVFGLNAAKPADLTPDGICTEILNEMNQIKVNYPNENILNYYPGPLGTPAEPKSFRVDELYSRCMPPEYLAQALLVSGNSSKSLDQSRNVLRPQLEKYNDDLLFFMFYNFVQDELQLSAAKALFKKGWRFHLEWKIWMSRNPNSVYTTLSGNQINNLIEHGKYNWFNTRSWQIQQAVMLCDFSKLDFSILMEL